MRPAGKGGLHRTSVYVTFGVQRSMLNVQQSARIYHIVFAELDQVAITCHNWRVLQALMYASDSVQMFQYGTSLDGSDYDLIRISQSYRSSVIKS